MTDFIGSESDFYQRLKTRTSGTIFWERIEPSTESGFPDAHYVIKMKSVILSEGTCEFKFQNKGKNPNLRSLLKGSQKSALLEYDKNKGSRRFYLLYHQGDVWLYNTHDAVVSVLENRNHSSALAKLEEPNFCAWLVSCLGGNL